MAKEKLPVVVKTIDIRRIVFITREQFELIRAGWVDPRFMQPAAK
jgi:hypothetical protein